jgi:hypothetical protein
MNKNDLTSEGAIQYARKQNFTAEQLGRILTGHPYRLTPVEATVVMHEYRRRYPKAGTNQSELAKCGISGGIRTAHPLPVTPKLPLRKAKAKPTVTAEGGELLTTPNSATAGRPSIINRSAVKSFALKVSREKRAGKFNRVSKEFLDSVEANLEALIREISQGYAKSDTVTPDPECDWFINGRTLRCAEDKLNEAVQKIVLAKVHGHPSIGKTLK